ncbi:hypothetical protein RJ639_042665 [Escallonia herrerae]|uniref:HSF-type DNA-binding domain-containing protein n=1 Tax=Escallonia herrerae TaxID=1293975 RepID=A0AA88WCN0_9ASTE|nr:hypothetical protein RJ639_042665 [Escallonia herrerae]
MVDDPSTEALISWSPNNDNSFVIWDENVFAAQLLPKYFKTNTLASFVRQLNIYSIMGWGITTACFLIKQMGPLISKQDFVINSSRLCMDNMARLR